MAEVIAGNIVKYLNFKLYGERATLKQFLKLVFLGNLRSTNKFFLKSQIFNLS